MTRSPTATRCRLLDVARISSAGLAGGWLCGLWIGVLTLRLNPAFEGATADGLALCLFLGALYAAGGIALGLAVSAAWNLLQGLGGLLGVTSTLPRSALVTVAAGLPLLTAALLPDTGLSRTALTTVLTLRPVALLAVAALLAAVVLGVAGVVLAPRGHRRLWPGPRGSALIVTIASLLLLAIAAVTVSGSRSVREAEAPEIVRRQEDRLPLVLLCIDGADPDDVLLPMVERGELPTFARLLREGTFGELKTIAPTLSPAVWTTIATGMPPAEHGIHHFIYFDLPFVTRPVSIFPLHTGLNFKIFPRLERLPGAPVFQAPYTSELRRRPALWNIVGEHATVGMFRWRVTWPAEDVNGFAVASDVALLDQMPAYVEQAGEPDADRYFPADAYRGTELIAGQDTADRLTQLVAKYRPSLVVAGYHSVDEVSHRYWRPRLEGGRFETAIDERYRFVDERLGETITALEQSLGIFNLVVVSDHGFDFERGHHTHAPAGLFIARGPAFAAGVTVDGLSVFDVAPMALDLTGLPVARDMPGARVGQGGEPAFRRALAASYRAGHPLRYTNTYGRRRVTDNVSETPFEDETLKKLRSLGYID